MKEQKRTSWRVILQDKSLPHYIDVEDGKFIYHSPFCWSSEFYGGTCQCINHPPERIKEISQEKFFNILDKEDWIAVPISPWSQKDNQKERILRRYISGYAEIWEGTIPFLGQNFMGMPHLQNITFLKAEKIESIFS